jgi:putative spermidine/putrescine transport system ATP-binding protein
MITAQNLTLAFDRRGIAGLHQVSFHLAAGQVTAILGPNGSGKTTLLKILAGALTPDAGSVHVEGRLALFAPGEPRDEGKNVQALLVEAVTLAVDAEKKLQLARDLADTFEFTLQLRQKLGELSAGQRQKVLLAALLINRPEVLLMDEPFAHLDPFTRTEILAGLFVYIRRQGISVAWVTHDLAEAFRFSDEVALLNFGRFEAVGAPLALVTAPRNLFVAQFVGYRNFFPVKFTDGTWSSPWGPLPYAPTGKDDALLVVPDHAWRAVSDGLPMTVVETEAGLQLLHHVLDFQQQRVHLLRSTRLPPWHPGTKIHLSPKIEESFLIPL